MVLLLTAVLGIAMFAAIGALGGLRRETAQAMRTAEFERAAMTAEARFEMLLLTEPLGPDGLYIGAARERAPRNIDSFILPNLGSEGVMLGFDSRPYRWRQEEDAKEYRVGIQDEAGLINIYQSDVAMLERLFRDAGMEDTDATNFANALVAYNIEPGMHPPMRRASEIYRIEDATALLTDGVWRKLADRVVAYPDSRAININTAPASVLKVWFDLTDEQAQDIVEERRQETDTPGINLYTQPEEIGARPTNAQSYTFSGGRVRFLFSDPATGDAYQSSFILTPADIERPVWVENARYRHLKPQAETEDDLEDFPEIPAIAS